MKKKKKVQLRFPFAFQVNLPLAEPNHSSELPLLRAFQHLLCEGGLTNNWAEGIGDCSLGMALTLVTSFCVVPRLPSPYKALWHHVDHAPFLLQKPPRRGCGRCTVNGVDLGGIQQEGPHE